MAATPGRFARKSAFLFMLLLAGMIGCAACQPAGSLPITPTPTATATPTAAATPTIVWFPPTATPTPFSTPGLTPTPEQRPGVGSLLFADTFTTGEGWPLVQSARANVSLGDRELTLTVLEPRASVTSILQGPTFADFYMEITAVASLCSGEDQYGVILRAASSVDFYRFALSCNGQMRLDRLWGGSASSPQPWLASSAVPPAAAIPVRLGVWAVGKEMRFFINGQYQFTVVDPIHLSGGVGVFARSAGETAVTVNFSDLAVYAIEP